MSAVPVPTIEVPIPCEACGGCGNQGFALVPRCQAIGGFVLMRQCERRDGHEGMHHHTAAGWYAWSGD